MILRGQIFLLAIALMFQSVQALAQSSSPDSNLKTIKERGSLIVGTAGTMPPMTTKLEDGTLQGFDVDLATLLANSMEVDIQFKVLPFDQLIGALEKGEVDMVISNMSITPKRNMNVAFVGPYITSGKCLITRQETLANASKSEVDKVSYSLAVLKGTTTEEFVKELMPNVKRIPVDNISDGVNKVISGEASALVSEFQTCALVTNQYREQGFVTSFSALTYEPIGIAVNGNDVHLINWTENFLERVDRLGLLKLLAEKWLGDVRTLQPAGAR